MWALLMLLPFVAVASPVSRFSHPIKAHSDQHQPCQAASVLLSTVTPTVDFTNSDDALQVQFTLHNPNSVPVTFLKRETPIDGLKTNMFEVRKEPEGKLMQYRGMEMRRAAPGSQEYISLAAGESLTRSIRIGDQYSFEGDGMYSISYAKHISGSCASEKLLFDSSSAGSTIEVQGSAAHQLRYSEIQAIKQLEKQEMNDRRSTMNANCNAAQVTALNNWQSDAIQKINAAIACTESSCSTLVDTWFGSATTQSEFASVVEVFNKMLPLATTSIYNCPADAPDACDSETYAYVYPSDPTQTQYICEFAFTTVQTDYMEGPQTIIHELSHFNSIGGTTDDAYGQNACYQLAQSNPTGARRLADNYAYFAVFTNVCYLNAPSGYAPKTPPCGICDVSPGTTSSIVCSPTSAPTAAAPTAPGANSAMRVGCIGSSMVSLWLGYMFI